jgi:hypothetical protein
MKTIDNLLLEIVNFVDPTLEELLSPRDARVLRSMASAANSLYFITENQSKLITKILRENCEKMPVFKNDILKSLSDASWSKQFRVVQQVKKFYIAPAADHDLMLHVEFTFSSQIRKILSQNSKNIEGVVEHVPGKLFLADLTEKNIVILHELLSPHGFEIDILIKNHYETIKSWSKNEVENQFLLTTMSYPNFQKAITQDLGLDTAIDNVIIKDRGFRYQYFVEKTEKSPENLTEIIASRNKARVWVDSKSHSLDDTFTALTNLKRLPVLLVFDGINPENNLENLEKISEILDKNRIFDKVGIYFRLPNTEVGKRFNSIISTRKYNTMLDSDAQIVGVQNGKIPKFFMENKWKPMSVLAIGDLLKNNKTSVYANYCDLIVTYSDKQPLIDTNNLWL